MVAEAAWRRVRSALGVNDLSEEKLLYLVVVWVRVCAGLSNLYYQTHSGFRRPLHVS